MIVLDKIVKRYGQNLVLRGVDAHIKAGEFVSIMGASGSGKSTMLNIIGALDTDYEGDARVAGRDLRALPDREVSAFRNTTIGFVFQSFHLLPHLSCGQNVAMPAYFNRSLTEKDIARRVGECLERVGLSHKRDEFPLHLSGGERQRIAIARAMYSFSTSF